jgi:hypothetical protein
MFYKHRDLALGQVIFPNDKKVRSQKVGPGPNPKSMFFTTTFFLMLQRGFPVDQWTDNSTTSPNTKYFHSTVKPRSTSQAQKAVPQQLHFNQEQAF